MLPSELAAEVGIDPSVFSKHLTTYYWEAERGRERILSPQSIADIRKAHALIKDGRARSFREAVQMALGTYAAPVPPESARQILQRIEVLQLSHSDLVQRVDRLLQRLEGALTTPSDQS